MAYSAELVTPDVGDTKTPLREERAGVSASASGDTFKGICIFLIIFGHNKSLEYASPEFRAFLYLFHVAMFLYLPFLRPWKTWGQARPLDLIVRYGWPCVVFTFIYTLMFVKFSGRPLTEVPMLAGEAVLAMSARGFDHATGLQLLWFLPALIGIRLVMMIVAPFKGMQVWGVLVVAAVAHSLIGLMPEGLKYITPFGWPVAALVLFPGLIIALLNLGERRLPVWAIIVLGSVALVLTFVTGLINRGHPLNVGMIFVPSIAEPLKLLALDLMQLSAFVTLMAVSRWSLLQRLFGDLGRMSFELFVLHQPIYIAIRSATPTSLAAHWGAWTTGAVTLALTIVVAAGVAAGIRRLPPVSKFLFPRGAGSFGRLWSPRLLQ
jgi:fucose 4-O-acetylase-like acetyltransferase